MLSNCQKIENDVGCFFGVLGSVDNGRVSYIKWELRRKHSSALCAMLSLWIEFVS